MGVNTQKYIRKPLYVDAVRVTDKNFDEIVAWCQGEVETEEVGRKGTLKKFIRVRVHNPKNPRQTKAFIGDWVLYTERGYKVYKDVPFREAFDLVADVEEVKKYPYEDGDVVVLGPEIFVGKNDTGADVISWKGENYVTQAAPFPDVEPGADLGTTPQGEQIEVVEATPQAIADTVAEQPQFEPPKPGEDQDQWESSRVEPVAEGIAVESSPTSPPTPDSQPGSGQPLPDAAGKYVLSQKEQADLGPDGVRELLASGEAVLAQDLAESA